MRLTLSASLALALASIAPTQGDAFQCKQAYEQFLQDTPGQWVAQWHPATNTPKAIFGTGLPIATWSENSLEHARQHANQALLDHGKLLGLGTSEWRESIGARMGRTWSFKFDQYFGGLQAIDGRADVRIHMKGRIAMLGSVALPIPANFDTTPQIGEELATALAWQRAGNPTGVPQPASERQPRLVILGDTTGAGGPLFTLAWEIPISNVEKSGEGPIGRYYVDAKIGTILQYRTDKHECGFPGCTGNNHALLSAASAPLPVPTTVTVMAWTRTGLDAWSALVNTPLEGLEVNVPGLGTYTTDANGEISIDIAAATTITVSGLDGRHHRPIAGTYAPTASQVVNPGVAATIQIGASNSSADQAAHQTTSYWVDQVNEYCRTILGNSSQMNTASNILPTVNRTSTCNAYYTGNTINFYYQGGGCANTAFSTVITHEWGHGLDDRYGGISNTNADGVSEGWSDIIAMYLVDHPVVGQGFSGPGTMIRTGLNTRLYPYSGSSPHAAGQVWMGFAWHLRENLRATYGTPQAIAISDDIVISSIVADAVTRIDCVREVFIADDDDGNLANGTPHYNELSAAAITKNLPYPQLQLAYVSHAPLANTDVRLTPRKVTCDAGVVTSGQITAVTLHYSAAGGPMQVRNMHPNGTTDEYEAMLPGLASGLVNYHIEAVHNGTTTVRSPATGEHTYVVDASSGSGAFTSFWNDDFEGASQGWTHAQVTTQDDWQMGTPTGKSGTGWNEPTAAASGANCWGNDLGIGNYNGAYQNNVHNYLRSPVIDCTGRTGVALRFNRWLTVEEGIYDQATILVNGVQVWQNQQNGDLIDTAWTQVQYSLPMADNNPAVQIEFRLESDAGLVFGGWTLDDVQLGELYVAPLDAELTMLPEQAAQNSTVNIAIQTQGSQPFVLAIGGDAGPTLFPGIPPILVGSVFAQFPAWSDASGQFNGSFLVPNIGQVVGNTWFSQVVTLDATGSQIVTSNQFLNLFTQTP